MTKLTEAMLEQMAFIVLVEGRPVSYKDFLSFKINEKEWKMQHGTFRNIVSDLMKTGQVKLAYKSNLAFYTLPGHDFKSSMTPYHTEVNDTNKYNKTQLTKLIEEIPLGQRSIHNLHLTFHVDGLWNLLHWLFNYSAFPKLTTAIKNAVQSPYINSKSFNAVLAERSFDIIFPSWNINSLAIKVAVHKNNTVSVTVKCSRNPVAVNTKGLFNLVSALTRTEHIMKAMVRELEMFRSDICQQSANLPIPSHNSWIVTMWHFNRDAIKEFAGEKFSITLDDGMDVMTRVYTKEMNKKTRLRLEKQEYPNKTLLEAIEDRLSKDEA